MSNFILKKTNRFKLITTKKVNGVKDLLGKKYGKLAVCKYVGIAKINGTRTQAIWRCLCDCGKHIDVNSNSLQRKDGRKCCSDCTKINITDKRYGRLVVKEFIRTNKFRNNMWLCKCDCGNSIKTTATNLRIGRVKSCGCYRRDISAATGKKNTIGTGNAAKNSLFFSYKRNAKNRGIAFDLTKEEFLKLTAKKCFYCGQAPISIRRGKSFNGTYTYNGVDRKNNSLGYEIRNCVPCCKTCNYAKRQMTMTELTEWIKKVFNKICK